MLEWVAGKLCVGLDSIEFGNAADGYEGLDSLWKSVEKEIERIEKPDTPDWLVG